MPPMYELTTNDLDDLVETIRDVQERLRTDLAGLPQLPDDLAEKVLVALQMELDHALSDSQELLRAGLSVSSAIEPLHLFAYKMANRHPFDREPMKGRLVLLHELARALMDRAKWSRR